MCWRCESTVAAGGEAQNVAETGSKRNICSHLNVIEGSSTCIGRCKHFLCAMNPVQSWWRLSSTTHTSSVLRVGWALGFLHKKKPAAWRPCLNELRTFFLACLVVCSLASLDQRKRELKFSQVELDSPSSKNLNELQKKKNKPATEERHLEGGIPAGEYRQPNSQVG